MSPSEWICGRLRPVFSGLHGTGDPKTGALSVYVVCVAAAVLWLDLDHGVRGREPFAQDAWMLAAYGALPVAAAVGWDLGWRPGPRLGWLLATLAAAVPVAGAVLVAPSHAALLVGGVASIAGLVGVARWSGVDLDAWGLGVGEWRWWVPRSGAILGVLLACVLLAAAASPDLRQAYPNRPAARDDLALLLWLQASMLAHLFGWELFFRGFLLFGVARRDKVLAVLLQALPFFLLHARKAELETIASFVGAVLAGWLCLRGRSFLPLVGLHWGMNTAMQLVGYAWRVG